MLKTMVSTAIATVAVFGVATAASAQQAEPYVGATVNYHTIDGGKMKDKFAIDKKAEAVTAGVVAGVDMPVSPNMFVGIEGNYAGAGGQIDNEYGVAAKLGGQVSPGTKLYAKGGYQWVDVDTKKWAGVAVPKGTDTTVKGALVGLGADFAMSPNTALRLNVDTIEFKSAKVGAGVAFKF